MHNFKLFLILVVFQCLILTVSGCAGDENAVDGDIDGDNDIENTTMCMESCISTCERIAECEISDFYNDDSEDTCQQRCESIPEDLKASVIKYYGCTDKETCEEFSNCISIGGDNDFTCNWPAVTDGDEDKETVEDGDIDLDPEDDSVESEEQEEDVVEEDTSDGDVETEIADGDDELEDDSEIAETDTVVDGDDETGEVEETSPEGYSCYNPVELDLGQSTITATTVGAVHHYTSTCGESNGEEMVYTFTIDIPLQVEFHSYGFDTVLYLRKDCEDRTTEIACNDDVSKNKNKSLDSKISASLSSGTYYLFVDGFSQSSEFNLDIKISCSSGLVFDASSGACVDNPCLPNPCEEVNKTACILDLPSYTCGCDPGYISDGDNCIEDPNPTGDSCDDPMPLEVLSEGSISGSNLESSSEYVGSCSTNNGAERVYAFVLDAAYKYNMLLTGYDTVMYLRTTCDDSSSETACNDDYSQSYAGLSGILQPGMYYLFADSFDRSGNYTLNYDFTRDPCADDPCPGVPECVPTANWQNYNCVCPDGFVPFEEGCVDDPCEPDLCTEGLRTKCIADLPDSYHCNCKSGYIDDGNGICIEDPNSNAWSFFVFLNADNNLEEDGHADVAEMGTAGSTVYVHIVSLFDTYSGEANDIYITEGGYDVVESLGEIDMSDPQVMADFGKWAVENYPSRHNAFIMWDHGAGWEKKSSAVNTHPIFKGFSNDDHGTHHEISISNGEYASAMQQMVDALGRKFDIVGFDACLMGMWEVAEASAPFADYFIASSETEPVNGWAYDGFLPQLVADPLNTTALDLSKNIVDSYYDYDTSDATLAVSNLGTMDALATRMTNLANALMAHKDLYSSIENIRSQTQKFNYTNSFRDLYHFAHLLTQWSSVPGDIESAAQSLLNQLDITIAYNKNQASSHPDSYGLSIYFPSKGGSFNSNYRGDGAVWSDRTTWDDFLVDFTGSK